MSYYYLILLILVCASFVMSEARLFEARRYRNALDIGGLFVIVIIHFWITWYKMVYQPDYDPRGVVQRIDIVTTSILIPLLYLYLCRQFSVKLLCATTYCIFGSLILCFFTRLYFVLDNVVPQTDMTAVNLYIFYKGKVLWNWNIYELCLFFQSFIVAYKIYKMKLRMTKRNWSLTVNSNRLFIMCIGLLVFTICVALLNDVYWNTVTTCIYISTYGVLVSALMQMAAMGYDMQPVVDANEEPQYLEVHPKFKKMGAEFERLLMEDKIYLNSHLTIEEVAQMLCTNRTYVSKMVKETRGESFTNVVNKYRLEYAKEYIREHPDMKLEFVATESGFGSTSAFCKVFKDLEGITPSQWRPYDPIQPPIKGEEKGRPKAPLWLLVIYLVFY